MAEIYVLEFQIGMEKAWSCLICDFTPSSRRVLNRLASVIRKALAEFYHFSPGTQLWVTYSVYGLCQTAKIINMGHKVQDTSGNPED